MKHGLLARCLFGLVAMVSLLASACQQEMSSQPSYRPLEPAAFFKDGRSSRPLLPGTVARGRPLPDSPMLNARKAGGGMDVRRDAALVGLSGVNLLGALSQVSAPAGPTEEYANTFPFPITLEGLRRGQERYTIYCALCHDPVGTGHGKIVERGYLQPPNYHTDYSRGFQRRGFSILLRDAPVGYYYEVISQGYGGMPDYAAQIQPADRWKIIAYVRALQRSQRTALDKLSVPERQAAQQALENTP